MPKGGAAPAPEELGYDLEAMTYAVGEAGAWRGVCVCVIVCAEWHGQR